MMNEFPIYSQCIPVAAVLEVKDMGCGNYKLHIELSKGTDPWVQWVINGKTSKGVFNQQHGIFNDTIVRFTTLGPTACKAVIGNNCGSIAVENNFTNTYLRPYILKSNNKIEDCSEVHFDMDLAGNTDQLEYHWTGDDLLDTYTPQIKHTYLLPGKYNYQVAINNNCGDKLLYNGSVNINNILKCSAGNDFTTCIDGGHILLNAKPEGGQWFGKGIRSNEFRPEIAGVGSHELVYMYRENGCVVFDTAQISVLSIHAEGDFSQLTSHAPAQVQFFNNSYGSSFHSTWNFGDGEVSVEDNPIHTYKKPGEYIVSIEIMNELTGCTNTNSIKRTILVEDAIIKNPSNPIVYNSKINILPNPSMGVIQVNVDKQKNTLSYDVQISDLYGKILLEYNDLTQEKFDINIPDWPAGCFVVTIHTSEGNRYSQKLISVR